MLTVNAEGLTETTQQSSADTEVEVVISAKTEQKQNSLEIAAVLCR